MPHFLKLAFGGLRKSNLLWPKVELLLLTVSESECRHEDLKNVHGGTRRVVKSSANY